MRVQEGRRRVAPEQVLDRIVPAPPVDGAVSVSPLAVTGLTHRESYRETFSVTVVKALAVLFVIAVYYLTGLV